MERLKLKELVDLYKDIKKQHGAKIADNIEVMLGDDEELNGCHGGYYAEVLNPESETDKETIENTYGLEDVKELTILIS